jgi:hypothetical protein
VSNIEDATYRARVEPHGSPCSTLYFPPLPTLVLLHRNKVTKGMKQSDGRNTASGRLPCCGQNPDVEQHRGQDANTKLGLRQTGR